MNKAWKMGFAILTLGMVSPIAKAVTPEEMMRYLPNLEEQVRPWSWDHPQRWAEIRKTTGPFTEEEIDIICQACDLAGDEAFAVYYPDILFTTGYMNLEKDTRAYGLTGHFLEEPSHYLYNADGTPLVGANDAPYFNLENPELREWWLDQAAEQIAGNENEGCSFFTDALAKVGVVAGGDYYDYWGNPVSGDGYWDECRKLLAELRDRFADKVFLAGNFARPGTGRTPFSMDYLHISYIESFEHFGNYVPHAHEAIALMQELADAGKWMQITVNAYNKPIPMADMTLEEMRAKAEAAMPDIWAEYTETERDELAEIYAYFDFKLAMFLMGAGERSYLKYTASKVVRTSGRDLFKNIMPFPEWNMPLGEPLEGPQRNGNIYTRRFEHVEVVLNLDNGTCEFNEPTSGGDLVTTLSFSDLNTALSGNTLSIGGSSADLSVSGAASGNDYLYSVTYTGADFDEDSVNDTLTFDVLVEGLSGTVVNGKTLGDAAGNSVTDASATIGSIDTAVSLTTGEAVITWVVGADRMSAGETLKFSVVNATSNVGSVEVDGFSSVFAQEWYTHSHQAIIGEGIDSLDGYDFNNNLTMAVSSNESPLYISAANGDSNNGCWGVGTVNFRLAVTVEVVEPPIAHADHVTTGEGIPREITLSGTDPDGKTNLIYEVVDLPSHGVLAGTAPSLTYSPDPGYVGTDLFMFSVYNGITNSEVATVSITVTPRGLLAHWPMDDDNGPVVTDVSGNGFHGTLTGGARVDGTIGGALEFNGSVAPDTMAIPVGAFDTVSNAVTIAMWVRGDSALQPRTDSLFAANNADGQRVFNIHLPYSNGKIYWDAGDVEGSFDRVYATASAGEYEGLWNHWVFTKDVDSGMMAIYLNGALWLSNTGMTRSMDGVAVAVLGSGVGDFYYEGALDDVRLYNYALSAVEVSNLFQQGSIYSAWAAGYGLSGVDASLTTDGENGGVGDGYNNLTEYALGMNPATSDAESALQVDVVVDDGTNWFEYIHYRRADYVERGLSYLLIASTNLLDSSSFTNSQDQVIVGPSVDGYEPVTNRYEIDGPNRFIKFEIYMD